MTAFSDDVDSASGKVLTLKNIFQISSKRGKKERRKRGRIKIP